MRDAVSTLDTDQAAPSLPNEDYLFRRVNRLCQNLIPKDPKDHTFKVYILRYIYYIYVLYIY